MTSAGEPAPPPVDGPSPGRALSPRARVALPIVLLALVGLSVHRLYLAESEPPAVPGAVERFDARRIEGRALGTTYSVTISEPELSDEQLERAADAVRASLERVDELMSTWRDDSELSRLNAWASTEPFAMSDETLEVLELARQVSLGSGGAFDVTVAPLVAAWGFGAGADPGAAEHPPDERRLAEIGERVGFEKLAVDRAAGTVSKQVPDLRVDLSAIAKGYAVDQVAEAVAALGHASFLVEVGGEIVARGRKADGGAWRVAIEQPSDGSREVHRVVELEDRGFATSGDYRDFYEREGRRISHTIDPRTRRPIEHGLASVSVVHQSAALADAWATALDVLGPAEGLALAEHVGLAAYLIVRRGDGADGFETRSSTAFAPYLAGGDPPVAGGSSLY